LHYSKKNKEKKGRFLGGYRRQEGGGRRQETGDRRQRMEVRGDGRGTIDKRKHRTQKTGDRRQEGGGRRQEHWNDGRMELVLRVKRK
jgi:hypothetical protein